jgi:hypothetical protein
MTYEVKYPSPNPDLREKVETAMNALTTLADAFHEDSYRVSLVEQIEKLNIERQAKPVSLSALKETCSETTDLLERLRSALEPKS